MSLLRRHPLVAFFALAYLISWSVVPFGLFFTPEPLIAALIVVPLTQGRAGLRQWARFVVARHRVHRLRRAGRPLIRRSADRVP
jgi:hypothetical protein